MNNKAVKSAIEGIDAMDAIVTSVLTDKDKIKEIILIIAKTMIDIEREECAKECDKVAEISNKNSGALAALACAEKIRKREINYFD